MTGIQTQVCPTPEFVISIFEDWNLYNCMFQLKKKKVPQSLDSQAHIFPHLNISEIKIFISVNLCYVTSSDKEWTSKLAEYGFPSWSSGYESTFQCRGHGLIPGWGTKISHATGQQSPRATTREKPAPQLEKPARHNEEPVCCKERSHAPQGKIPQAMMKIPHAATKTRCSQIIIKQNKTKQKQLAEQLSKA